MRVEWGGLSSLPGEYKDSRLPPACVQHPQDLLSAVSSSIKPEQAKSLKWPWAMCLLHAAMTAHYIAPWDLRGS